MRIVVNDIAASTGGAMTVLRDFYACVCEHDKDNQWIFLLNDRYFEETDNVKIITLPKIKKSHLRKLWFDFVAGKKFIERLEPDVVFSLQNIITFGVKVPQVVYIHQPLPFQKIKRFSFFRKDERSLAKIQYIIGWFINLSARRSDRILVQTEWMKEAVCEQCGVNESKVIVCLPPIDAKYLTNTSLQFDKAMFFYPTSNILYKNNLCIQKASDALMDRNLAHTVILTLPPEQSKRAVRCVGRLPYESVMEYYKKATLIFPSYIETFGYPLAEARLSGALVLASDTPFSREVLREYENAYFFDPFKPETLMELMKSVVNGTIQRKNSINSCTIGNDGWRRVIEHVILVGEMKE